MPAHLLGRGGSPCPPTHVVARHRVPARTGTCPYPPFPPGVRNGPRPGENQRGRSGQRLCFGRVPRGLFPSFVVGRAYLHEEEPTTARARTTTRRRTRTRGKRGLGITEDQSSGEMGCGPLSRGGTGGRKPLSDKGLGSVPVSGTEGQIPRALALCGHLAARRSESAASLSSPSKVGWRSWSRSRQGRERGSWKATRRPSVAERWFGRPRATLFSPATCPRRKRLAQAAYGKRGYMVIPLQVCLGQGIEVGWGQRVVNWYLGRPRAAMGGQ